VLDCSKRFIGGVFLQTAFLIVSTAPGMYRCSSWYSINIDNWINDWQRLIEYCSKTPWLAPAEVPGSYSVPRVLRVLLCTRYHCKTQWLAPAEVPSIYSVARVACRFVYSLCRRS
jgi:hypothetical protein